MNLSMKSKSHIIINNIWNESESKISFSNINYILGKKEIMLKYELCSNFATMCHINVNPKN